MASPHPSSVSHIPYNGIGFGDDTTELAMSYHHHFYDVCGSRMPRISYKVMVYAGRIKPSPATWYRKFDFEPG